MTKLEELKAAYEVATPSCLDDALAFCIEWDKANLEGVLCGDVFADTEHFTKLAHNLMPTLLEAVDLLETLRYSMSQYDDGEWFLHGGRTS